MNGRKEGYKSMTKEQENFISELIEVGDKLNRMKNNGYIHHLATSEQLLQIQDIARQILTLSDEIYHSNK